jgi:hypothetical protein
LWHFEQIACACKISVALTKRPKLQLVHCYKERTTAMSTLNVLKLVAAQKSTSLPQVQQRRNKLLKRIWEQIELAKAEQSGTTFAPVKLRSYTDKESGVRKQVETNKRVKAWWFTADNGKLALSVRFGPKVLELAKGKFAVEVADKADLINTLEVVRTAVDNGELDAAIENAAKKLREGFAR